MNKFFEITPSMGVVGVFFENLAYMRMRMRVRIIYTRARTREKKTHIHTNRVF